MRMSTGQLMHTNSYTIERAFITNVVYQENAHGTSVVRGCYRSKSLLACTVSAERERWTSCIPNLKLNFFPVHVDGADLEVYADGRDERRCKLVLAEAEEKT